MSNERTGAPEIGGRRARAWGAAAPRRAARTARRARQLARVRDPLRTPPSSAVSLLPLDPARRARRAGRAAVNDDTGLHGAERPRARAEPARLAVSDRSQESITILRKRGRELDFERSSAPAASGGAPHDVLESRERLRQLVGDLHELPERQRSVLVMRELSGLSMQEIAGALTVSPAAAKQSLFEARGSLQGSSPGWSVAATGAPALRPAARARRCWHTRAGRCFSRARRERRWPPLGQSASQAHPRGRGGLGTLRCQSLALCAAPTQISVTARMPLGGRTVVAEHLEAEHLESRRLE